MHIFDEELKEFANNRLNLDFSIITIKQNSVNNPKIYKGPGNIAQSNDGEFILKIYCQDKVPVTDVFQKLQFKVGKIISKDEFYTLSGVDFQGRHWAAEKILPNFKSHFSYKGILITAKIRELSQDYKSNITLGNSIMTIRFAENIDIPCNTTTRLEKTVGEKKTKESLSRDIAQFSSCGYDFTIQNEENWFTVKLVSDANKILDSSEIRICETFQFVLARTMQWSVIEIREGNKIKTRLRPIPRETIKSRMLPSIPNNFLEDNKYFWLLFEKYFQHIIGYPKEYWHPISGLIHSIIESSSGTLDVQGLTLGVSVEGILKSEFSKIYLPNKKLPKQIEKAKKVLAKYKFENFFEKRIDGMLAAMLQPRADDILRFLKDKGLIKKEFIFAWKKLRNTSAHPDSKNKIEIETFLNLCHSVTVLFYNLVFLAIGYTGKYRDYSLDGWPIKDFDKTLK